MRSSTILLAAMLVSACTHVPAPTPSTPPTPTTAAIDDPGEPPPPAELPAALAADPNTTVLVMEADDLGVAWTPSLPSPSDRRCPR